MKGALSLLALSFLAGSAGSAGAQGLPAAFGEPTLVADIFPGPPSSFPRRFEPVAGGAIFFVGPTTLDLGLLWRTDGTRAGTVSIHPAGVRIHTLFPTAGPYHWFQAHDANGVESVWRTDGTAAGTIELVPGLVADSFSALHRETGLFYFYARASGSGTGVRDLWVSDGTPAGTRRLVSFTGDPVPGARGKAGTANDFAFSIGVFATLDDELFFLGPSNEEGGGFFSLWRTDGTPEGTRLVAPPPAGFEFRGVWGIGSILYLVASTGEEGGNALWRSDGTAAGTVVIKEFEPRTGPSAPIADLGDGRSIWLIDASTVAASPPSLWVTDGTPAGTVRLMNLAVVSASLLRRPTLVDPRRLEGLLYIVADDGTTGFELWRTDGTPAGTRVAFELCPGPCSGLDPFGPFPVADRLLIFSGDDDVGTEPIATDGTAAGTVPLGDLCPGPCSRLILDGELLDLGGAVLFPARTVPDRFDQLWITDLTPAGTVPLTDFAVGITGTFRLGDKLLLAADDGALGMELWSLEVPQLDPLPPAGPWLASPALPGFEVKVRIARPDGALAGALEPDCIPETVCVSGALPGRAEVFVRVVGPKGNGRLWPTLVKLTTSTVEVWIRQASTGVVRSYRLEGARPGVDELPGLFDREGFTP